MSQVCLSPACWNKKEGIRRFKKHSTNVDDVHLLCLKVSAAASVVSQALGDLLQHVRQYTSRGEPIGRYDQATDTIMTVTESIFSSMGDAGESTTEFDLVHFCFVIK